MDAIVAVDRNWAIGRENGLLFSLPTDMKHFRQITTGGTVLMGRKTLESFPHQRPLPNRRNIVLTSQELEIPGAEVVHTLDALCAAAANEDPDHVFVIGGGSVYTALLSQCRRVYLTKVDAAAEQPDTFFPDLDRLPGWTAVEDSGPMTENGLTFRFLTYVNQTL